MFFINSKKRNHTAALLFTVILLITVQPLWAAGPPAPSIFSNALAVTLIILMIILLIVIGILSNILIGAADIKIKKRMKVKQQKNKASLVAVIITGLTMISNLALAQADPAATDTSKSVTQIIGGMSSTVFYLMTGAIFLELLIILVLLANIKILLKAEKEIVAAPEFEIEIVEKKSKPLMSWWNRVNKFKPVAQEADIDLGHDYDGIRELDNRLPPWWLYGFYITIVVAGVYLWRAHVSHAAPSSKEEYEMEVRLADIKVKEYLKQKGDAVDENTVTMLGIQDIEEGKQIFIASCAVCHKENGGGIVGPNLTDDYWIHGGDLKNIFRIIKYGVDGKGMASWQNNFSPKQIAQLTSYVKSLKGTNPPDAKAPQGELFKDESIPAIDSAVVKQNNVVVK